MSDAVVAEAAVAAVRLLHVQDHAALETDGDNSTNSLWFQICLLDGLQKRWLEQSLSKMQTSQDGVQYGVQ